MNNEDGKNTQDTFLVNNFGGKLVLGNRQADEQ